MTLSEMLTDLGARIGSDPEVTQANMTTWINAGLRVFCNEQDWTWMETSTTDSTVADQETYDVPSDYNRLVELQIDGTSATPNLYTYVPWEQRVLAVPGQQQVSKFADQLYMYPIPGDNGSSNIDIRYIRTPSNMTLTTESPSDSTIANMPNRYHEALVIYAFAVYNTYDEEHSEAESLMGSVNSPRAGSYYYFVDLAKRDDAQQKRGERTRMLSKQEFTGYSYPNQSGRVTTVLGN